MLPNAVNLGNSTTGSGFYFPISQIFQKQNTSAPANNKPSFIGNIIGNPQTKILVYVVILIVIFLIIGFVFMG